MRAFWILSFAFCASFVQANLSCLTWDKLLPTVGVFCHFVTDEIHFIENVTAQAVQALYQEVILPAADAIKPGADEIEQSAKDLLEFDLKVIPVTAAFQFGKTAIQKNVSAAASEYVSGLHDALEVSIGFGKGTANQAIDLATIGGIYLYDVHNWGNVASSVNLARNCAVPSVLQNVPRFKLNGTNENVGSTISTLATLLVPLLPEAKAATVGAGLAADAADALALGEACDLGIPGTELRVFKQSTLGSLEGESFAAEAEAQGVKEQLSDPEWASQNCNSCNAPSSGAGSVVSSGPANVIKPVVGATTSRRKLIRRGLGDFLCCLVSKAATKEPIEVWDATNYLDPPAADPYGDVDLYNPPVYQGLAFAYGVVDEASLVKAPQFIARDLSTGDAALSSLRDDLATMDTAVVPFSANTKAQMSTKELFPKLRSIFTNPDSPEFKAFGITHRDGTSRLTASSRKWLKSPDPVLKPYQDFVNAIVKDGIDTVGKLLGMDASQLRGNVEFFWVEKGASGVAGVDPRGLQIDKGLMQFIAADTKGAVTANTIAKTASRLEVVDDSLYCVKALGWQSVTRTSPTIHGVWGPEMAAEGRASLVMSIKEADGPGGLDYVPPSNS